MKIRFDNKLKMIDARHGQSDLAWWQLFSTYFCKPNYCYPSTGYRLWVYTRYGAFHIGIVFYR